MKGRVGTRNGFSLKVFEQEKPSTVKITRANGTVRFVDPVTREERTPQGRLIRVVPPEGFNVANARTPMSYAGEKRVPWRDPFDVDPGVGALPSHRRKGHTR